MSKGICLLFLSFWIVVLAGGCAGGRRDYGLVGVRSKNLVFNPEWTGVPYVDISRRSDWPASRPDQGASDRFEYLETIVDYQGRAFGGGADRYYRRLYSVRGRQSGR